MDIERCVSNELKSHLALKRQQRSAQASVASKSLSSLNHLSQPLPPSAATALSTFSRAAGQVVQIHKIQPSSTGNGSFIAGHNIISSAASSASYNHSNKSHQLSPGYMLDKLSEYSRRKQESDRRKVAERELDNLNMKIDKLLLQMEDSETQSQSRLRLEDEVCVVCLAAPATMQTFPCGHKVVCRKCLIKTIQVAVSQRCLPLRCVICRDRILTLHHTTQFHCSPCTVTDLQTAALQSTLIPPISHICRPVASPVTPTSPTGMFSLFAGFRYHSNSPRLLSAAGTGILGIPPLTSSTNIVEKVPKLTQGSMDEEFIRFTPTDIEAFVNSHNDALNMHKFVKPNELEVPHKYNRQNTAASSKRSSETTSHNFMHCQSVKIHPTMTEPLNSFMESPRPDSAVLATLDHNNLLQKPVGASKFLSKILPRKGKRKCNWFRQEN